MVRYLYSMWSHLQTVCVNNWMRSHTHILHSTRALNSEARPYIIHITLYSIWYIHYYLYRKPNIHEFSLCHMFLVTVPCCPFNLHQCFEYKPYGSTGKYDLNIYFNFECRWKMYNVNWILRRIHSRWFHF